MRICGTDKTHQRGQHDSGCEDFEVENVKIFRQFNVIHS